MIKKYKGLIILVTVAMSCGVLNLIVRILLDSYDEIDSFELINIIASCAAILAGIISFIALFVESKKERKDKETIETE